MKVKLKDIMNSLHGVLLKATILLALSGLFFGLTTAMVVPTYSSLKKLTLNDRLHTFAISAIVSSILFGATIGSLFAGTFTDMFGKKKVMIVISLVSAVGGTIYLALAPVWINIVVARAIQGISVGAFSSIAPSYLAEIAPKEIRGFLGTIFQFTITFSIFIVSLLSFGAELYKNSWRLMFGSPLVIAIPIFLLSFFMDESPTYLISKNQEDKAREILLTSNNAETTEKIIKEIKNELKLEKASWGVVFSKMYWPHLTLGIMMCVSQQWTGINAIIYYITEILTNSGIKDGNILNIVFACAMFWNFITTVVAIIYIERFGRRFLILLGMSIISLSLLLAAIGIVINRLLETEIIVIISIFTFLFGFEIGIGPLFWVVVNEIFPRSIRDRADSFITGIQWLMNFILSILFYFMVLNMKGHVFWIFFGVSIICTVYLYFFLVATKGLSFEEIQKSINAPIAIRN